MKELKASDKVAQKMTHDGAVQENLATGEVTNISSREAEADFFPSEEPAAAAESAAEHIAAAHGRRQAKKVAKAEADTVREGSAAGQRRGGGWMPQKRPGAGEGRFSLTIHRPKSIINVYGWPDFRPPAQKNG